MLSPLCEEIHKLFLLGIKGNNRELFDKAYELSCYFVQYPPTLDLLEPVIDLERELLAGKGPHKHFVEECVFQALSIVARYCAPERSKKKRLSLDPALLERPTNIPAKQKYMMALKLEDFSEEVFQLQNPRDAFNSKRKGLALDLLRRISVCYDVPKVIELCKIALASNKKDLVLAGVEFYESYMRTHEVSLTTEMITLLDEIVWKTKNRFVAVAALNLKVEAGVISKLGALSSIDDWEERNPDHY